MVQSSDHETILFSNFWIKLVSHRKTEFSESHQYTPKSFAVVAVSTPEQTSALEFPNRALRFLKDWDFWSESWVFGWNTDIRVESVACTRIWPHFDVRTASHWSIDTFRKSFDLFLEMGFSQWWKLYMLFFVHMTLQLRYVPFSPTTNPNKEKRPAASYYHTGSPISRLLVHTNTAVNRACAS